MLSSKKKPGLASISFVLGSGKSDKDDKDSDYPPEKDSSGNLYSAAIEELASIQGIPEDKLDAFKEAFEAAVMSCK